MPDDRGADSGDSDGAWTASPGGTRRTCSRWWRPWHSGRRGGHARTGRRVRQRLVGLPARGRRGGVSRAAPGRRSPRRSGRSSSTTSCSSSRVYTLHGPGPGGVAEPAAAAGRRHRGRPAGRDAARTGGRRARAREREARALFRISFALAGQRDPVRTPCPEWPRSAAETRTSGSGSRSATGSRPTPSPTRHRTTRRRRPCHAILRRQPGRRARRVGPRAHAGRTASAKSAARDRGETAYRVAIVAPTAMPLGVDLGESALASSAIRTRGRRGCSRPPPTRSAGRSSATRLQRDAMTGRGLAPERRPQVGPARFGLARPADAAGLHPGGRRDADGSGGRLAGRNAVARSPPRSTGRPTGSTGSSPTCST